MKRMYQIILSATKFQKESAARLLVLLAMLMGGMIGGILGALVPGLGSQILNLCALGILLGCIWALVALLNL